MIKAWFTPDIPFQFGPIIYSGLPGMILELKQGYYIFTAQEIEFSQKDIIIAKPTKGKNIDASMWPAEKNKIKADYMKTRTY